MTVRSMRASGADNVLRHSFNARRRGGGAPDPAPPPQPSAERSAARLALAREIYAGRRRRERFFPGDLFGEPTWDILIDLYIAWREERRVPTTSACIGAHVPPTTALRWLRILEVRGYVEREDDGRDGRRTFVRLSQRGATAIESFLDNMIEALENVIADLKAGSLPNESTAAE